jgi:mono/diheme cytochrome c family protein
MGKSILYFKTQHVRSFSLGAGAMLKKINSKRSIFVFQLSLLLSMALFVGCNYSHVKGVTGEGSLGDLATCGPIDYETVHKKIFLARCISCHNVNNAEKGILLDSFSSVKANIAKVQEQVEINKMPLGKPLDPEEKKFLFAWISQGAPETTAEPSVQSCNNETSPTPAVPTPSVPVVEDFLEPSYNSLNKKIFSFQNTCTGCHGPRAPSSKAKYDFSSFKTTVSYGNLFNFTNPRESRFVQVLESGEMPARGTPLSAEQIDVIVEWIRRGLPEETGGVPGISITQPSVAPALCDDLIDFKEINETIFQPVCLRCHGFATLPEFDSYANIRQNLVSLERMVRLDKMPPRQPLAQDLKDKLFKWIQNGSPETVDKTGCSPTDPPNLKIAN